MIREVTDAVVGLTQKYGGLLWGEHGKGVRSEYSPRSSARSTRAAGGEGGLRSAQPAQSGQDRHARRQRAADGGRRADPRPGGPRHPAAGARIAFDEAMHCNGNGACYDWDPDAAMCPSWKATRDRRHSPKGRAMLVKEWLRRLAAARCRPGGRSPPHPRRPGLAGLPRPPPQHPGPAPRRGGLLACGEGGDGRLPRLQVLRRLPDQGERPGLPGEVPGTLSRPIPAAAAGLLSSARSNMCCPPWRGPRCWRTRCLGRRRPCRSARLGLVDTPRLSGIDCGSSWRGVACAWRHPRRCGRWARPSGAGPSSSCRTPSPATTRRNSSSTCWTCSGCWASRPGWRPSGRTARRCMCMASSAPSAGWRRRMRRGCTPWPKPASALVGIDPSMTLTYRAEYAEALERDLPKVLLLQEWLASRTMETTGRAGAVSAAAALHGAHHRHGVPPRLAIGLRPAWPPA